jgi:NAD(P)-dependent dehydrogenase (short-subunit alcohol dehydrogenase family)
MAHHDKSEERGKVVNIDLKGKKALITGAAGGIGSAVARQLSASGADLFVVDLIEPADVAQEIHAQGGRCDHATLDVANVASIGAVTRRAEETMGGIDILVTAAGITDFGCATTLDEARWNRMQDINLRGVFFCCQAAMEPMRRRGGGRIVNIGSILGKNGGNARPWINPEEQQYSANVAYGVAKAGVHMLTIYLARELAASYITVNAVAPGPIASAMTTTFPDALKCLIPVGRMGSADEVAAAVTFLASEQASFITGEIIDVNGGMWAD